MEALKGDPIMINEPKAGYSAHPDLQQHICLFCFYFLCIESVQHYLSDSRHYDAYEETKEAEALDRDLKNCFPMTFSPIMLETLLLGSTSCLSLCVIGWPISTMRNGF